ncbi:serine/threonine-protein kinase [Streptomyces polygonati]|uniref:non-specific serine/threonine protein kinase n=1 Tax=Streptomyces polygonati TaxID=1617087 RepID=A0ABV8HGM1_9ACTN
MASDGGETAPSSPPRDMIADRYRITDRLGRGGMGTVWRATDELLRRQVAVKELHLPDEGLSARQAALRRERALREARTAALIRHPHVVVVHDVVEHQGHPWIVMELIDGSSLARVLERDGPLPPREAARVGAAVAGALRAAHEREIQHRDVKPANILIEHESGRVVLTDFGIARVPGAGTISETGGFVGSPEYTAPERMSGRGAGPASDLWSLGALLCAAVHGESPFRRDSIGEIVHAVAIDELTPPAELGPLLPVVLALLDRDPVSRMGAVEAQRLLRAFAETGEEPAPRAREAAARPEPGPGPAADAASQAVSTPGPEPRLPPAVDPLTAAPAEEESAGSAATGAAREASDAAASAGDRAEASRLPAAGRPSSHRARGRKRKGGIQVVAVGALVVLAVSTGTVATFLVSQRGSDSGAGAAPATPPPSGGAFAPPTGRYPAPGDGFAPPGDGFPPLGGDGPFSPPPDGQGPPPGAPGTPPLPPGFHRVSDPAGFSVVLPPAFVREAQPPHTYYWSPDHIVRFGERERRPYPGGAYAALKAEKAAGPRTYPGYRDGSLTSTQEHGLPAVLWEFGYEQGGARVAFELCWTENGRMFDISLSAPASWTERARGTFEIARGSFRTG